MLKREKKQNLYHIGIKIILILKILKNRIKILLVVFQDVLYYLIIVQIKTKLYILDFQ